MPDRTVENRDPATGALIGNYRLDGSAQVGEAIEGARRAQPAWAASPYRERSRALGRVGKAIAARADELASIISANSGKTRVDALATEIVPAAMALRFYRSRGKRLLAPRRLGGGSILMFNKRSRLYRVPYGVVGVISPWNYPFAIPFSEIAMALLAGNGVVLKVASDSLAVGESLAAIFADAGLPDGLFAYVNLPGREAGDAFISGGIDKLFFTGSTEVGRELMAKAASRLVPVVLELGGNDAAIIRADADLDRAASGILWSGFSNAGQSCGGAQRILVHESIYDAFAAKLKRRVEGLRIGIGSDLDVDMGCLASSRQKALVEAQVARCLAEGAQVIARSPLDPDSRRRLPARHRPGRREARFARDARGSLRSRRRPRSLQGRRGSAEDRERFDDGPDRKRLVQGPQGGPSPRYADPSGGHHDQRPPDVPRPSRDSLGRRRRFRPRQDPRRDRLPRDAPDARRRRRHPARRREGHLVAALLREGL